jgi:transcriptional regulator with XRE-family HTH domain
VVGNPLPRKAVPVVSDTQPDLVGARIREIRHYRGMPIKTLAGLSGLSVGFLSMVENGRRYIERRSHLVAIAEALQVSVPELVGQPLAPVDAVHSAALASVPGIRAALVSMSFGEEHEPSRTVAALRDEVARIVQLRKDCDYANLGRALPELLLDLDAAARRGDELQQRDALALLVDATQCCCFTLKYLGFPDLAMRAAELCHGAAQRLGDPAWSGVSDFTRLHSLPPDARHIVSRLSTAAADRLQPHLGDPRVLQVYGMLHLTAALSSAVALQPIDVQSHMREAREIARRTGEGAGFAHLNFGPTNVGFWDVAITVELGEGGKVAELVPRLNPQLVDSSSRQASFFADVGRGLAHNGRRDQEAIAYLSRAEKLAPQRIRTNSAVRETVAGILRRARRGAGGRDLRALAHRCGIA